MKRVPLRPLARIISAREKGEDPDLIEAENLRKRNAELSERDRFQAERRLLLIAGFYLLAFVVVAVRMGVLASVKPQEPHAELAGSPLVTQRADIVDRNGMILATNLVTNALYAQPDRMFDKAGAARQLAGIFPDMNAADLLRKFNSKRKFIWLRRKLSPEQQQRVHDIGDPGLALAPREMRLYPNGRLAAHVLGGAGFGREGVQSAEIVGRAGVEYWFDSQLRDPARQGRPLQLSLDLPVQAATRRVLAGGMKLLRAKGAAAVLMNVDDGEILALVSLPDFDPNDRPAINPKGRPEDQPVFNRAAQGVYELGSTFKAFTAAAVIDQRIAGPDTVVDTKGPIRKDGFTIKDSHYMPARMSLTDVVVKSSNVGAANLALELGSDAQKAFLKTLGLLDPSGIELPEARKARPLAPGKWTDLATMTVSYGHGIAVTPVHLAAAYASLVNGGVRVHPTLVARNGGPRRRGERVISPETSATLRRILRQVVTRGTATLAEVPGYEVAGKTGTANKPKPDGTYYKDRVISTFASFFPASDPKYVLVVMLDEPVESSGPKPRRTAGWTAVPVAAEIIRRVAPLLGLRPKIDPGAGMNYTLSSY